MILSKPSLLLHLDVEYDLIVEFDKIVYREKEDDGVGETRAKQGNASDERKAPQLIH